MKTPYLPGSRVCFNVNNEAEYKVEADKVPGLQANVETLTDAVIALEDELGYSYFPQGYTSPFNYYAITVTANNGATTTGSGTYREGSEVTISVTPATDYHFTGWSDGEAQATRTITVTAAATYTATTEAD
jgi:hypothetical protein